jgi:rhamnogalacturonyl hydrolase YesR
MGIPRPVAKDSLLRIISKVNGYWQLNNVPTKNAFWDVAVYHTGNMEVFRTTHDTAALRYSEAWARHNQWMGAKSTDKAHWKYTYGESDSFVLFGDWQACFQTYADLYRLQPDPQKIARAREVMEYQMSTPRNNYWWWVDGLYMVMPVMVKLHSITGNPAYLEKMHQYWSYANSIMYDSVAHLYYRDTNYVFPKHTTVNGKKDFWARGDGWIFAAFAKILQELPAGDPHRAEYTLYYTRMAEALKKAQHPDGYWTRSLLDTAYVPGPETSGTAFYTYGFLWGMNNGLLPRQQYEGVALKAWNYLEKVALQPNGKIGYVQPIGAKAIPGQMINQNSTASFGVGAFLLAACEMYRYVSHE